MLDCFDFEGQVALVTGCSSGLGVQMARALASKKTNIVAVARRKNKLDTVVDDIKKDFGVEALAIETDINKDIDIKNAVDICIKKFGKIDILVNDAGGGDDVKATDLTDEKFMTELNLNVLGTFRMIREVANMSMIKNRYGRIINIASIYGLVGNNFSPCLPYHTTKGAIVNMTRALAVEWSKYNITVNAICPGYFETPLIEEMLQDENFIQNVKRTTPIGRPGKEGELDTAILFLASKMSTYVTGVILPVDGGYTCV